MIILITGTIGSGKSLYAIKRILEFQATDKDRKIFADIDGIHMPGVEAAIPENDWTKTPPGSVVIYDECQKHFGPTGMAGGRSTDHRIAQMEESRHSGHDLVLITQHPNLLHAHIRRLVNEHNHIVRYSGSHKTKVYRKSEIIDDISKCHFRSDIDGEWWHHEPKLYQYYHSADEHTHKYRMPNAMKRMIFLCGLFVVIIGGFFVYNPFKYLGFADPVAEEESTSLKDNLSTLGTNTRKVDSSEHFALTVHVPDDEINAIRITGDYDPSRDLLKLGGCVKNATRCICYTENGAPIHMSEDMCGQVLAHGHSWTLPLSPLQPDEGATSTYEALGYGERAATPVSMPSTYNDSSIVYVGENSQYENQLTKMQEAFEPLVEIGE